MRAAVAIALLAAASCSPAPTAEPAAAEPARAPLAAKPSDALSRAEQIAAEAARRESEYQQALEAASKPRTDVPVVTEFTPHVAAVPAYMAVGGSAPRPEEAWWRARMDPLRQAWHEQDLALRDANARWRASDFMKNGPEKDAARNKAIADQQRASAAATRIGREAGQLIEKARQMDVPPEWVKWP